jgi:hypothetical protein
MDNESTAQAAFCHQRRQEGNMMCEQAKGVSRPAISRDRLFHCRPAPAIHRTHGLFDLPKEAIQ